MLFLFAAHLAFELTGIRTSDFVSTPPAKGNNSGQGKPLSLKNTLLRFQLQQDHHACCHQSLKFLRRIPLVRDD